MVEFLRRKRFQPISIVVLLLLLVSCTNDPAPKSEVVARVDAITGIRISWDYSSLRKISDPSFTGYNGYARMVELSNSNLYCVYESNGNIIGTYSSDMGNSWSEPVIIAAKEEGINMSVPDILELSDKSLLACYNPRPYDIDPSRKFAIRTKISKDHGLTWQDERVLYKAGYQFENGCWEPSAIQLPDGEIQLYFANEGVYTSTNEQNISMLRSLDGGLTWTDDPEIVSFRAGSRDGMPKPLFLQSENEIAVSIEDNGIQNFKPYIIKKKINNPSKEPVNGDSPNRVYALEDHLDNSVYAGAPYIAQLGSGETLLSYQGSEGRGTSLADAVMHVAIGNPTAGSFNRTSTPFDIPPGKSGLWNSILVVNDQIVIALTSTNGLGESNNSEVWMVQGHVVNLPIIVKKTLTIDGVMDEELWPDNFPLFVGHKGPAHIYSGISQDDNSLYLYSQVYDEDVLVNTEDPGAGDGVYYYFDENSDTGKGPDELTWKIFLGADNQLIIYQGQGGTWILRNQIQINTTSTIAEDGYYQEMAIPKTMFQDKIYGVSIGMQAAGQGGNYKEWITGTNENQPYTWLRIENP